MVMTTIPDMRHRVFLQEPTITRNERGAEILTYSSSNEIAVSANIRGLAGQERTADGEVVVATAIHAVVIRYRSDVTAKWRIVWRPVVSGVKTERVYGIQSVIDRDGRMRYLTLGCQELVGEKV